MKNKVVHTTFRNGKLFCLHCGGDYELKLPLSVKEMAKKIDAFNILHSDCEKTWVEPIAAMDKSIEERATFWMKNGETGMSSRTIWNCMIGVAKQPVNYPCDPDDFSRCHKLLQQIPEWKAQLHKLKPLSKEWHNLVDNWDQLTEMYLSGTKSKWKKSDAISMYEFMQTLINPKR